MKGIIIILLLSIAGCSPEPDKEDILLRDTLKDFIIYQKSKNNEIIKHIKREVESAGNKSVDLKIYDSSRVIQIARDRINQHKEEGDFIAEMDSYSKRLINIIKSIEDYPPELVERVAQYKEKIKKDENDLYSYHLNLLRLENFILSDLAANVGSSMWYNFGDYIFLKSDTFNNNDLVTFAIVPELVNDKNYITQYDSLKAFFNGKEINSRHKIKNIDGVGIFELYELKKGEYLVNSFKTVTDKLSGDK